MKKFISALVLSAILLLFNSSSVAEEIAWGWHGNEEVVFAGYFQPNSTNFDNVAYNAAECLQVRRQHDMDSWVACNATTNLADILVSARDLLVTEISFTVLSAQTGAGGCSFAFTDDEGVTQIAVTELDVPASDSNLAVGDVVKINPYIVWTAGTDLGLQIKRGNFCPLGGTCACDNITDLRGIYEVRGIYR